MSNTQKNQALLERLRRQVKNLGGSGQKYMPKIESGKHIVFQVVHDTSQQLDEAAGKKLSYGEDNLWYLERGIHYLGKNKEATCLKTLNGDDCPICEAYENLRDDVSVKKQEVENLKAAKADKRIIQEAEEALACLEETMDNLRVQKKWLINVKVKGESGVRIFTAPWSVHHKILSTMLANVDEQGIDVLDPRKSYFWKVSRSGTTQYDTKYEAELLVSSQPLADSEEELVELFKSAHDLTDEIEKMTEAEVSEKLRDFLDGQSGEGEESPPPPPPKHSHAPAEGSNARLLLNKLRGGNTEK